MQKDLLEALIDKPQRETVGSDTSSRFDYQKNWAFCEMLRRHMANADYLVAFEFHDDAVFLSPNSAPTTAEFCQVKTSKSANARKLADLVSRPKHSNSILGKMFMNFEGILAGRAIKVVLVSNVAFEFSDQSVSAKDIAPSYRGKIIARLKDELTTFCDDHVDNLYFVVTGISIDAMNSFLHGEAMELFKRRFGEDHGFNVHSWVRLVQSEIARKNNYPSDRIASLDDLVSLKCVARNDVDASLALVSAQRRAPPDMTLVRDELKDAGWSPQDIVRLGKKMPQAVADYTDSVNLEVAELVNELEEIFARDLGGRGLSSFLADARNELLAGLSSPYNDPWYLAALSVVVYYEEV